MPPSILPKGGSAPWPPERGDGSPLPPSYGPGGPGGTSRPVAGRDEPPSCLRQGREGVAPRASRLLACGKSEGVVSVLERNHTSVREWHTALHAWRRGKSCLFLKLVAAPFHPPYPPLKDRDSAKSKGQNKPTTRAEKSSTHTRGRRPKAACATQSSLPSFLRKKAGKESGESGGGWLRRRGFCGRIEG